MYDYNYGYDYMGGASANDLLGEIAIIATIVSIITLLTSVLMLISLWKVYTKAGKPGWASIIPIYNIIVLLEITGLPVWYIALMFIPFANIYAMFKIYIELAHKFGKSTGFGLGMIFLPIICLPILAFSKKIVYNNVDNIGGTYQPTYQPAMNPTPQPEINNNGFVFDNNMAQNMEVPQAPQMPLENQIPVQNIEIPSEPMMNSMPQPEMSNNGFAFDNNMAQNMEVPQAPQMPLENQMPVQNIEIPSEPMMNPMPQPEMSNNGIAFDNNMAQSMPNNNNQNGGLM